MKSIEPIVTVLEYDGTDECYEKSGDQLRATFEQLPVKAIVPIITASIYVFVDKTDLNQGMHLISDLMSAFIVLQTTLADNPAELEKSLERFATEIKELVLAKSVEPPPTRRPN